MNTLPAFPLDGGRLLRAALLRLGGSQLEATRVATRVSQALSIGVILGGVMLVPLGAGLGLWLGFVGWFIFLGATTERRRVEAESALAGVRVADVMTPDPATIAGRSSARGAAGAAPPHGAHGLSSRQPTRRSPWRPRPRC